MITYLCNMCNSLVVYAHAYVTKLNAGDVSDEWVFCPECFSAILSKCHTCVPNAPKFERRFASNVPSENTVEPDAEQTFYPDSGAPEFKIKRGKRLTAEAKKYLRDKYAMGGTTYASLASELGVSLSTVFHVINDN